MKVLTGCDDITARFLYNEFFSFTPIAKFWLAFNHKPMVDDASHGFWRRVRLIPFLHRFEGEQLDKHLMKKLRAEAPGILAWAVRGCLQWQREGLGLPGAVQQATDEYQREADIVGEFLEEQCVLDIDSHVPAVELWAEFREWALLNGERMDRRTLANRLEDKGFRRGRLGHSRTRVWFGIRLKSVSETQGTAEPRRGV